MSPAPDRTLADPHQVVADLRRALAECEAERDAALAREAATSEVLQVINSSPSDLAPVFDAILEKAHSLCGADYGALLNYDGERFRPVAGHGGSARFADTIGPDGFPPPPGGALWELTRGAPYVQIVDMAETAARRLDDPMSHALVAVGGIRTQLVVSLRKDETLLGAITANRREVRAFTDKEIALLQNFAAQAVIAMENARLLTETREALEQQSAAAEVLGVINSSPGNLAPVFDAMLEKATRLCEASFGILWSFTGDLAVAGALYQVPEAYTELCRTPFRPSPGSGPARMMRGEGGFALTDLAEYPPYLAGDALTRAIVDLAGARSVVIEPLRKDSITLGAITLYRQEVYPFTDKQIALLQNFAAQAVIAMENARLITETREALEQQTATAEVLQVINSSPGDLSPVFDAMLERATRLSEGVTGVLWTIEGERVKVAAAHGFATEFIELLREHERPEVGPAWPMRQIIGGERVVHIVNVGEHDLYQTGDPLTKAGVEHEQIGTFVLVALVRDGVAVGAFSIGRREVRPFSDKQIALLQNFAAQAVIAMENARLLTETREALEQQTATAEVLQVINSSPGDLAPVFDAILEKAMRLCDAEHGHVFTIEDGCGRAVAARGEPEFVDWIRQHGLFRPLPGGMLDLVMRGERIVHRPDATDTDVYRSGTITREIIDKSGVRTTLGVALRSENALLGAIVVNRQEVRLFTDKQIALLQNFATQAVIAMENARLITETREALEQQTATAEVLQAINSSPGDLAPVFDAMLEKALRLCDAVFGIINSYDGELFHPVAMRSPPALADTFRSAPNLPRASRHSGLRRIVLGEDVVQIEDLAADPVYQEGEARRVIEAAGAHSYLGVALRLEGKLLGTIGTYRQEVRSFTDKQIALLQNFAAQAVIAMENARLLTETREALEQQTATAEVLQVINSSPGDLAPVFDAMLEKATRLCEAPFGILRTWDGERFHFGAVHGDPTFRDWVRQRDPSRPDRDASPLGRIQAGERVVRFADEAGDEGYWNSAGFREMVEASGIRRGLWVALRKDDELLGTITVFRREPRPFSEKQIALLENFAAQAVIAMENARLITETREALEQQTATAEVLQVINSSPGDLAPVFETILEKAHTLCGATYGGLVLRDRDGFRNTVARGDLGFVERWRQVRPLHPPPGSPLARLMLGEKVIHLADAASDDNYRNTTPLEIQQLVEFGGLRTLLMVPLRTDNAFLGVITAYRLEVQPFSDKQIALLENFAAQAVIAIENARLLGELHQRTEEVAELNRGLEARVAEQVDELGRVGRLKRFLAPQLAEMIVSQGDEEILESHRREIVVVFCDLRGYTAFTETAEPEEVLDFLREYHGALGPLVSQYEGTLDQFSGDGIMVFFNDPVPCPDPAERAVKMAIAMREAAGKLIADWRRHSHELGFGAGIAQGYATLGQIGFSERSGYTAIGTVCNLAARLCAEAKDGQILVSSRIAEAVEAVARLEDLGNLDLKGLRRPVAAFNVVQSTSPAEARPNLTVVTRGPGA